MRSSHRWGRAAHGRKPLYPVEANPSKRARSRLLGSQLGRVDALFPSRGVYPETETATIRGDLLLASPTSQSCPKSPSRSALQVLGGLGIRSSAAHKLVFVSNRVTPLKPNCRESAV